MVIAVAITLARDLHLWEKENKEKLPALVTVEVLQVVDAVAAAIAGAAVAAVVVEEAVVVNTPFQNIKKSCSMWLFFIFEDI